MNMSETLRLRVIAGIVGSLLASGCSSDSNNNPVSSGPVVVPMVVAADGSATDGAGLASKDGMADVVSTVGVVQVLHLDGALVQWESRAMWEFDLAPVNVTINEAVLALAVDDDHGPFPFTLEVWGYAGDGAITAADFSDGVMLGSLSYDSAEAIGIDVTAFVSERLDMGDRWAGFVLRFDPPSTADTNGPFVTFGALEAGPGPARLLLEVP